MKRYNPSPAYFAQLRNELVDHLNLDELKTLCLDIDIPYEDFGASKSEFIRLMLEYCKRHDKLIELVDRGRKTRPEVQWPRYELESKPQQQHSSVRTVTRVCFVSSEYSPHVLGGLGVHVTQLTRALGNDLDVDVVLPSPPDKVGFENTYTNIQLHALANSHPSYGKPISWLDFANHAADRIVRIARESPPDVIHCHDWVTVLAGIKCQWQLKIPLVFHLHLPNQDRLCGAIENLGLVCADLVTVNSNAMAEELRNRRLPLKRVEVVKNGVDPEMFCPCQDWPAEDDYILFVGRLVEQKGVEYLLRAIFFAKEEFPHLRLKVVGEGHLKPVLERLCMNLVLSDRVEFLGWITGEPLVSCYQKASVVVVPSIYEPFGMTALEALSCQRPVLASRVGGLEEIVKHNRTGFLAECKDELDLAQWLMTLLSSSELRNSFGKTGREGILRNGYTWPEIAQRFIQLYNDLQGERPRKDFSGEARKLKKQVVSVAQEMKADDKVLDQLFEGMT